MFGRFRKSEYRVSENDDVTILRGGGLKFLTCHTLNICMGKT